MSSMEIPGGRGEKIVGQDGVLRQTLEGTLRVRGGTVRVEAPLQGLLVIESGGVVIDALVQGTLNMWTGAEVAIEPGGEFQGVTLNDDEGSLVVRGAHAGPIWGRGAVSFEPGSREGRQVEGGDCFRWKQH